MSDWRRRARITGDVVFFEYVTSKLERTSDWVYVWDIDKTYLDTHFESLKGLLKTALEKAFQKKNVPGARVLVRYLTLESGANKPFPIYFISASPPQMEQKIRTKLEIDGINPYGAFFKDNLRNLKPKYFRRLTQQVGFKLQALLQLRVRLKDDVKMILFGDDSETDAVVYSLFSDICSRRLTKSDLVRVMDDLNVIGSQQEMILELQDRIPTQDPVERIYINLANDTDPDYYEKFGRRCFPSFNTFQIALDLYQDGRLSEEQLSRVAQDMILNYGFTSDELSQSFENLLDRRRLTQSTAEKAIALFRENRVLPSSFHTNQKGCESIDDVRKHKTWIPDLIDYFNDFR